MRSFHVLSWLTFLLAFQTPATAQESESSSENPLPEQHSFYGGDRIDGRVGSSLMFMTAEPFAASTGYGQFFFQLDYDGIKNSPFGFYLGGEVRQGLFEPRSEEWVGEENELTDCKNLDPDDPNTQNLAQENIPTVCDPDLLFYRNLGTYLSGRQYNYLRLDRIFATYNQPDWGVGLGRQLISAAASAPVDGLHAWWEPMKKLKLGFLGGLKSNPWHQRVVGASSGFFVYSANSPSFSAPTVWGTQEADDDRAATQGAYSNNQLDLPSPWAHFFSTEFLTSGLYARWQDKKFYNDFALVSDFFRQDTVNLDRLWLYLNGHYRPVENLNFHWRTTLDVVGERNFLWRNAFLDATWNFLPKQTVDMSLSKYRTLTTAYSFYTYFRPLELQDSNDWPTVAPETPDDYLSQIALRPLNNDQLFVVDRQRLALSYRYQFFETFEVYSSVNLEERRDGPAGTDSPLQANSAAVPVNDDPIKWGTILGVRDTFLGGLGVFDFHLSNVDGYFQKTQRVSSYLGANMFQRVWVELGGAIERKTDERVFTSTVDTIFQDEQGVQDAYVPFSSYAFFLDAMVSFRLVHGLFFEGQYFGYTEEVPFQGHTVGIQAGSTAIPQDTMQHLHGAFGRLVWRY